MKLMENKEHKLKEIKYLVDKGVISLEEYYKLRGEILGEKVDRKIINPKKIQNAGSNVMNIFYSLVFDSIVYFFYEFYVKREYGKTYDSLVNNIEEIETLSNIYYFIHGAIILIILSNLLSLGENLKSVLENKE
jgi:hypothetical protein